MRVGRRWSGSGWSGTVLHREVIASVDVLCLDFHGAGGYLAIDVPECYAVEAAFDGHF